MTRGGRNKNLVGFSSERPGAVAILRDSLFRFSLERPKDVVMHDVVQICLKRSLRGLDHNKRTVQTKNLVAGQCLKTFPGSRNNKWALAALEERFLHSPVFDNRLKPFDVLFHFRFVRNLYRLLLIRELPLIVLVHYQLGLRMIQGWS